MKPVALLTWAIATVFLSVVGATGSIPTAADAARLPQAVGTCSNIQLTMSPTQSQGAAGHIAVIYRLHNMWNQSCTLFGYPGVQLLNRNFLSLPTHLRRGAGNLVGGFRPKLVRLAAFGNAYFALGYSDVPVNNQPCSTVRYVMIIAPNDRLPDVTYAAPSGGSLMACGGNINVTPVTARPRYQ